MHQALEEIRFHRILDPTSAQMGIEALGFEEAQMKALTAAIE